MFKKKICLVFLLMFSMMGYSMLPGNGRDTDILLPEGKNDPGVSNYVMIIGIKSVDQVPGIESVRIQPGRVNEERLRSQPYRVLGQNERSTLVLYDSSWQIIFRTDFDYPVARTVPMRMPGSDEDFHPDVIFIPEPEVYLVVPYFEDVYFIEVYNPYEAVPAVVKYYDEIEACYDSGEEPLRAAPEPVPAEEGKLHVVIIASGFNSGNMADFRTRAESIKNFILSKAPFQTYAADILIHIYENTANLGCAPGCYSIPRLMCCNNSKVIAAAAASGFLYDEIIVVHNTNTYSGGGYRENLDAYKVNSYNSYAMTYKGGWRDEVALHEFGHSFGNLCDEYTYTAGSYQYSLCVNCRSSCNDWAAITSACQLGCDAKPDYYRPEDSVMLDIAKPYFNSVSIQSTYLPDGLLERLQFFLNYKNLAPVFAAPVGTIDGREGTLISFTASATDPENDTITYSSVNLPPRATFHQKTADFLWTPSYTEAGTYQFKLKASDGKNTTSQNVTIQVKNVKVVKK